MPMVRDEQGGGTEADGSKSGDYCSHCYQDGAFVLSDCSVDQMVARVKGKLAEMGVPPPAIDGMTAGIPSLRRWTATQ